LIMIAFLIILAIELPRLIYTLQLLCVYLAQSAALAVVPDHEPLILTREQLSLLLQYGVLEK